MTTQFAAFHIFKKQSHPVPVLAAIELSALECRPCLEHPVCERCLLIGTADEWMKPFH